MAKRLVGRRAASHLVPPAEPRTRTHARSHSQPLPRNGNGQRGWSDGLHRGARDRLGAWSSATPARQARAQRSRRRWGAPSTARHSKCWTLASSDLTRP